MRCPTWRDQDVLLIGVMRRRSKRWRMGTVRRRAWWAAAASPRYYLVSQYYSVSPLPSVRYVMKVTADVPWGVDGEGSLDLFVTRVRDLNQVTRCLT